MLSQVKRKQKLLLTLTLTVLITGSILAFSIQAAYSAADYNSSRSNTQTSIEKIVDDVLEIGIYAKILGDANLISSIEILSMDLQKVKQGLVEMDKFYSALESEFQSLKKTTEAKVVLGGIKTSEEIARTAIPPEKIGIAKGVDMFFKVGSAFDKTVPLNDKVVIVIDESILGDEMSGKFIEYLKVTLSDARIASIVENERTTGIYHDEFELTKSGSIAPGPQPEDIKPKVPEWVRNNAGWYAEGLIPEGDFVRGLEWMINNGIIQIAAPVGIGEEGVS